MPNGSDIPDVEWVLSQDALRTVEGEWEALADRVEGVVDENYHNYPSRSVVWQERGNVGVTLYKKIGLSLVRSEGASDLQDSVRFILGVFAWFDDGDVRYGTDELLGQIEAKDLPGQLPPLLEKGLTLARSWRVQDLHRLEGKAVSRWYALTLGRLEKFLNELNRRILRRAVEKVRAGKRDDRRKEGDSD